MEIHSEFSVGAAPATVYEALLDLERVGPCIPGAEIGAADADGGYPAEIAVRVGPMRLTYRGTVRVDERDDPARRATLVADVRETRGQGTAHSRMSMTVSGRESGSHVDANTVVELTGRAAQMGSGIVESVAARLVADMATNLERLLASEEPAAVTEAPGVAAAAPEPARPIGGLRLLLRALWDRVRHRGP